MSPWLHPIFGDADPILGVLKPTFYFRLSPSLSVTCCFVFLLSRLSVFANSEGSAQPHTIRTEEQQSPPLSGSLTLSHFASARLLADIADPHPAQHPTVTDLMNATYSMAARRSLGAWWTGSSGAWKLTFKSSSSLRGSYFCVMAWIRSCKIFAVQCPKLQSCLSIDSRILINLDLLFPFNSTPFNAFLWSPHTLLGIWSLIKTRMRSHAVWGL